MPTSFRDAERSDFDQWLTLWAGYNAFYKRTGPTAVSRETTERTWNRFFDHYEPMHCCVAEDGGTLLGLVHFIYHRNTTMHGPTCYLQDLFTNQQARGQGIGTGLIEAVYERAASVGAERVYWHTQEDNATARRVYDAVARKSGFIVYQHSLG